MTPDRTTTGIAYERPHSAAAPTVVLVHAGIADRRMWDPVWARLTETYDAVRLDLRGFGDSTRPPTGALDHVADVLATIDELGIDRAHLVGSSYGSGVVVEAALTRPGLAASLLLCPPGGSLLTELTDDLQAFFDLERTALDADDLDAAVQANIDAWVVGHGRGIDDVDPAVIDAVRSMQRRAFEVQQGWPEEPDEVEMDPPASERLGEIAVPTVMITGALDLETTGHAADLVAGGIPESSRVDWPDVAHLPSMERPDDFVVLLDELVSRTG